MKLLIAEDDLTSRTILVAVTRKWGYESVAVEDGEAAWQVLQQDDAPALLLIDWEMPRLNGLELCYRIRQRQNNNPPFIILLTARNDTADIVQCLQSGANDHIAKPFDNTELHARLEVGQRMLRLQEELHEAKNKLANEREIIDDIIQKMRATGNLDLTNIRRLEAPVEKNSGDILLSAMRPDKGQHLLLGDFTGHGLTAAIGGPIVSDIFYSMTAKGLPMQMIIAEINCHLYRKMPTGLFCAAIFLQLDAERRNLMVWNCGMQDVLIFRDRAHLRSVASGNLALGIMDLPIDASESLQVAAGDRVYAYSDGITEAFNSEGEEFGVQRLQQAIGELLLSESDITLLSGIVHLFRGEGDQLDDITLAELSC